jgi:hypothetical protein
MERPAPAPASASAQSLSAEEKRLARFNKLAVGKVCKRCKRTPIVFARNSVCDECVAANRRKAAAGARKAEKEAAKAAAEPACQSLPGGRECRIAANPALGLMLGPIRELPAEQLERLKSLDVDIEGPYGWPNFEGSLPPLPAVRGVYVQTFEYENGFVPFGVGITRRPMRERFVEHTRCYVSGDYNVLDVDAGQQGIRKVVWKGWGWTHEKRADFKARTSEIVSLAQRQLLATRIFTMDVGVTPRLLERIEAAIVNHYYQTDDILIDRGMLLMPRWKTEEPIIATFRCASVLHGFPSRLEI